MDIGDAIGFGAGRAWLRDPDRDEIDAKEPGRFEVLACDPADLSGVEDHRSPSVYSTRRMSRNRRVIALDRADGHVVWEWKAPKGSGFVSLLLDGDRLMVGVSGYIYCLDPTYGQVVWENPLKGYGSAVSLIVSVNGSADGTTAAAAIAEQTAAAAAAG